MAKKKRSKRSKKPKPSKKPKHSKKNKTSKKTKTNNSKCKAKRKKNRIGKHKASLPIIKVSARTKIPEFVENSEYKEDIESYLKHGKYLLFINGDKEEIETAITFVVGKVSDKRGKIIEEILRIEDCANKGAKELLDEILSHKLENKAVVLNGISKKNISFLKKIRLWFMGKESPLIIATLKKGKGKTYSPKVFNEIFGIIKLSSKTKTQNGNLREGRKHHYIPEDELIPFVRQDLKFLTSPDGGELKGGALIRRITNDIEIRFKDEYKAKYKIRTVGNLISKINTGKI